MGVAQRQAMSEADYLAFEDKADVRHEFVHGEVHAMSGASARHNSIAGALYALLHGARQGSGCRPYISDVKLRLDGGTLYYYPDVMLVCSPQDDHPLIKTQPCLLAEVISPSTEHIDRREKRAAYLRLDSLREYLVLSQDEPRIDVYQRADVTAPWLHHVLGAGDSLALRCLPLTLVVDGLYADLDFDA